MNDYEVSIGHLDALVAMSMNIKGVYGARMTGAGFGGCIIALVIPREVETFTKTIRSQYEKLTGLDPQVIETQAAPAARVIE